MSNYNSQEQTIYRNLAGKIQLGFYDDGARFPSAKEIAEMFQVSYCPAQRALKMLEAEGLIKLCRGKATIVLAKPFQNYLESDIFKRRSKSLLDLVKTIKLLSPPTCSHSASHMENGFIFGKTYSQRLPYQNTNMWIQFEQSLYALGSHTALSLYYDISAVAGSSFLDILRLVCGDQKAGTLIHSTADEYLRYIQNDKKNGSAVTRQHLDTLAETFFEMIENYLEDMPPLPEDMTQEPFYWEPQKGRTRYCDMVAIDLICKINQGIYPVGTLLPHIAVIADTYHISEITARRTIMLMNKLGVVKTLNGIGTRVIFAGDASIPQKLQDLTLDDNMIIFLEALQFLAITGEAVMAYTFPYISEPLLEDIVHAASIPGHERSRVATVGAILQAIVRSCPLAAIREIYSKLTHLLLKGSILRLETTGNESIPGWPRTVDSILKGCQTPDGTELAAACRQLFENNFASTKQTLLDLGIHKAEKVTGF